MKLYSLEDGRTFVRSARTIIKNYLIKKDIFYPEELLKYEEKVGVFTTLKKYSNNSLRGCIGFPKPIYPLYKALALSAIHAAVDDPRFEPLSLEELDNIIIEINILTEPRLIVVNNPEEYLEKIKIGEDGLLLEYKIYSGLLLPEVAVEEEWDVKTFLDYLCIKAGLYKDCWKTLPVKIYKFQSQIFAEKEPNGEIIEIKLKK